MGKTSHPREMVQNTDNELPRFSRHELYPVPDESEMRADIRDGQKVVLKCTLPALIVKLTSPVDNVDYNMLTDFFLVYRSFISSENLLDLIQERFQWAVETRKIKSGVDLKGAKLAEVVLVRTFVMLRHWLSNYFAQDFVTDDVLRQHFLAFINQYSATDRFLDNIIISIKKLWVQNVQLMWDGLGDVLLENNVHSREDWLAWKIEDVVTPGKDNDGSTSKKNRLSFLAIQNINNPVHRNESLISLLHTKDRIPLPKQSEDDTKKLNKRLQHRTGSMLLFPENASNGLSHGLTANVEGGSGIGESSSLENEASSQKSVRDTQNLANLSRVTNVSHMIKGLEYPLTPSVDVVIPPTPAKKIEFILQTSYISTEISKDSSEYKTGSQDNTNEVNNTATIHHKGIMGLLSKWKLNHNRKPTEDLQPNPPRVEKLIQYVFSISSLDNNPNQVPVSISSKFDILSARTIDEVEYLVSVENELLAQLEAKRLTANTPKMEFTEEDSQDYSVIDNLNLYKTVSSIANSVISLSKTLNMKNITSPSLMLSPSMSALERKAIRTSAPMIHSYNNSRYSISNALLGLPTAMDGGSPKRLVFHDSKRNSPTKKAILVNSLTNIGEYNKDRDSMLSVVTYDSELSRVSVKEIKDDRSNEETNVFMAAAPVLKRKENIQNLRRFNFEKSSPTHDQISQFSVSTNLEGSEGNIHTQSHNDSETDNDNEDIASLITAYEDSTNEIGSNVSNQIIEVRRPTSGRISIARHGSVASPISMSSSLPRSPLILGNEVFIERDNALAFNQDIISELEHETSELLNDKATADNSHRDSGLNDSDSQSVSTNLLFASAHASPEKLNLHEPKTEVIVEKICETESHYDVSKPTVCDLSTTPSIKSISNNESEISFDISSVRANPVLVQSTALLNQNDLSKQTSADIFEDDLENIASQNNKYLFSPNSENGDYASPEKNLNDLKQQFIDQHSPETSLEDGDNRGASEETFEQDHPDDTFERQNIDEKKLEDIINGIDDIADNNMDPVNLALMKLEGTYSKENKETSEKSPSINSSIAREVEHFEIVQTTGLPESARKRQSMFIQRRRNTMAEFSTRNSKVPTKTSPEFDFENTDQQIRTLLDQYTLNDPRLQIDNIDQHIPFILMYDSKSVANQLTLIEREVLSEVDWKDLLDLSLQSQLPQFTSWLQLLVQNESLSGVDLAIARFNLTVDWIISEIVMTKDIRMRRNTIQRFIHIADHCKKLQNFNSLMEIILALSSIVVQGFTETWRLIEPGDLLTWETLKSIPSLDKNYSNIRKLLDEVDPLTGCIPFIVVYLSDLSLNVEKRTWIVPDKVLNYYKFQTNVQIVKNFVQKMQWSKFYDLKTDQELLSKCVYITSLSHAEIDQISHSATV